MTQTVVKSDKNVVVKVDTEFKLNDASHRSTLQRRVVDTNTVDVRVSTGNSDATLRVVRDFLTAKILRLDDFSLERSLKSIVIQNKASKFLFISEKDENGREKSVTMISNGEVIFHKLITYSNKNQVKGCHFWC